MNELFYLPAYLDARLFKIRVLYFLKILPCYLVATDINYSPSFRSVDLSALDILLDKYIMF